MLNLLADHFAKHCQTSTVKLVFTSLPWTLYRILPKVSARRLFPWLGFRAFQDGTPCPPSSGVVHASCVCGTGFLSSGIFSLMTLPLPHHIQVVTTNEYSRSGSHCGYSCLSRGFATPDMKESLILSPFYIGSVFPYFINCFWSKVGNETIGIGSKWADLGISMQRQRGQWPAWKVSHPPCTWPVGHWTQGQPLECEIYNTDVHLTFTDPMQNHCRSPF